MPVIHKQIASVPGVSPLVFQDEALFRVAFPKDVTYYARSWLYLLRASHMEGGELGYKFVSPELVVVIGYRHNFIYVTPVVDVTRGVRLRRLCDALVKATGHQVILKKLLPTILASEVPAAPSSPDETLPLEDDSEAELLLKLDKLFIGEHGILNPMAEPLAKKTRTFQTRGEALTIHNDIRQVSLAAIEQFLAQWPDKHDSFMPMLRYLHSSEKAALAYRCRIFLENTTIKGLYVAEKMSLSEAGLYGGVTSKDEPGLTEWMDVHFFRELLREGIKTLYLGGAERPGITHFCNKLLPYKPAYSVRAVLYRPHASKGKVVTVRLATEHDIAALADLYRRTYNAMDLLGERWTGESARKFISHFHRRQPDLFFLAEINGRIAGAIVAAIQPWWDGNHLVEGEIFIDPEFEDQNKAVEKNLLKRLALTARSKYYVVSWDTLMPVVEGHAFRSYDEIGFQEMSSVKAVSADISTMLARLE